MLPCVTLLKCTLLVAECRISITAGTFLTSGRHTMIVVPGQEIDCCWEEGQHCCCYWEWIPILCICNMTGFVIESCDGNTVYLCLSANDLFSDINVHINPCFCVTVVTNDPRLLRCAHAGMPGFTWFLWDCNLGMFVLTGSSAAFTSQNSWSQSYVVFQLKCI